MFSGGIGENSSLKRAIIIQHLRNKFIDFIRIQGPRYNRFGSGRNSMNSILNPTLKSDDSFFHVMGSIEILDSTKGVRSNANKTDLGWF